MRLSSTSGKRRQAISLTPLIDVVFILLLFFMLSSSFIPWRQIDVSIPSEQVQSQRESIRVHIINNQGDFRVEQQTLAKGDMAAIQSFVSRYPEAMFMLSANGQIETGVLVSLMDQLVLAGAQHVSIAGALTGHADEI